ncbi:Ypt/Rab-GAP domain of gyp1p superfamily protein [Tanacetum coccineum]
MLMILIVLFVTNLLQQLVIYETSASDLDIIRDISRTFPSHVFYQERHGPGQRSLYNILKAYSVYDRDVGYVQSCHIVIAFVMPCFNRSIIGSAADQFRTLVSLIDIGLRGLKALLRKGRITSRATKDFQDVLSMPKDLCCAHI